LESVIPAQAGIQALCFVIPAQAGIQALCFVIPAEAGIQNPVSRPAMNRKQPAVYIMASRRNGTLYVGVTSNLPQRVWEHRNDVREGFTKKYGVHLLVYFELHDDMASAITREKQLKKWKRAWKLELIEAGNPQWRDLWEDIA
jgi:putative endonuclease